MSRLSHDWLEADHSRPATGDASRNAKYLTIVIVMYTYLAEGVGNVKGSMAFCALKQGYKHYASGCLSKLEIQTRHPQYAFVRSSMIPSMRSGMYKVKLILQKQLVKEKLVGITYV